MNVELVNRACSRGSIALCALLLTGACGKNVEDPGTGGAKIAPRIVLSPNGINGISTEAMFSIEEIRRIFPHRDVVLETRATEGEQYPVIAVRDGQHSLLLVVSSRDNVGSIIVQSDQITNSLGHSVGSLFSEVYETSSGDDCRPGSEEMSSRVLCDVPNVASLTYVFDGSWNGPDGLLPPAAELSQWRLSQIVWRP